MFEAHHLPVRRRPVPTDTTNAYAHSRTRTTSSNIFPASNPMPPNHIPPQNPMQLAQPPAGFNRRSPSVNTFSSVSSTGMAPPAAYRTSPTNDIRRSTSSRSCGAGSSGGPSYVALLRRQKATVWCERAQFEDPRVAAQQRAAKMRANREISSSGGAYVSSNGSGRTSTGLSTGGKVAAKIRHHGKASALGFGADSNYVGIAGVPLRLSAAEVEGEDSEDEDIPAARGHHRRTGSSGRSSTASGRRVPPFRTSAGALNPSVSNAQNAPRRWSPGDTPERAGSLIDDGIGGGAMGGLDGQGVRDDAASGKARSTASGSSAERADNVPDLSSVGRMPPNSTSHAALTREKSVRNPDDLRRRGSVDERTMTLSTGRLFIANPD
ncbi:hypothetical protein CMQ_7308 [Grosmannia clavigera kw1407]|uniref:Uncharacterized protein n=1 Tax=Grosmannia clavigera (strain kw1407 / UAMH 11150) TaxID=655863 RepID=F0XNZ5_GROCL|nr:uncharacterized protein CMQ_7308 [Grosmannia clavigera kw1407]EFX00306.1 hypothetical protein CMQ_7308 [Grosmannia clavigera kw1407]